MTTTPAPTVAFRCRFPVLWCRSRVFRTGSVVFHHDKVIVARWMLGRFPELSDGTWILDDWGRFFVVADKITF